MLSLFTLGGVNERRENKSETENELADLFK
jgi:hypothetical protein